MVYFYGAEVAAGFARGTGVFVFCFTIWNLRLIKILSRKIKTAASDFRQLRNFVPKIRVPT
jgi:hypothetical protein